MTTSALYTSYLVKLAAGTLTAEEAGDSRLDAMQRQALIDALAEDATISN